MLEWGEGRSLVPSGVVGWGMGLLERFAVHQRTLQERLQAEILCGGNHISATVRYTYALLFFKSLCQDPANGLATLNCFSLLI